MEQTHFTANDFLLQLQDKGFKWEQTRLPKGLSLPDKPYFHRQDRARHYAFRTADMSYLIYDEQLLDIESYLTKLQNFITWYRKLHLVS